MSDEDETLCPQCGNDLLIRPFQAEHAGLVECDVCHTVVIWKSPNGTRNWEITNIKRPDEEEE